MWGKLSTPTLLLLVLLLQVLHVTVCDGHLAAYSMIAIVIEGAVIPSRKQPSLVDDENQEDKFNAKLMRQLQSPCSWTISPWTECTVTCGGGLRSRSVQCLDVDGVIVQDCDYDNRPPSYQFCGQIDCDSLASLSDLFPLTGLYNITNNDGSSSIILLTNRVPGTYSIQQNTANKDLTITILTESISPSWIKRSLHIVGRRYNFTFQFKPGALITVNVDGQLIFSLSKQIERVDITPSQIIRYRDLALSDNNESVITITDVDHLYYYNGLLLHTFDGSKINPITDSGRIYYNPDTRTAFYITDTVLMTRMERAIALLPCDNIPTITETIRAATDSPTPLIISQTTQHYETTATASSVFPATISEAEPTTMALNPCHSVKETSKTKRSKTRDCKSVTSSSISGSGDGQSRKRSVRSKGHSREKAEITRSVGHLKDLLMTRKVHSFKRTGHIQGNPHSVRLRKARQSEANVPHDVPMKGHTSTSNFELSFDNGHINLLHNGKRIIELSNPKKQVFFNSLTLVLEDNSLKIINSSGHVQSKHYGVKRLITFNGTHISERRGLFIQVQVSNGQLFVGKDKAFYSSSQQLNMLLNDQLARVIPRQSDTMLMFQTLPGGDLMLLINGEPIVTLSDAEVREVSTSNFIQYANSTIYVHDVAEQRFDKVYLGVNHFNILNGFRPGLQKFNLSVSKQIPGGGRLYVHTKSGSAFYSRSNQINNAISEHIKRLSEPSSTLIFAITFETNSDSQNDGILEVVLSVNSEEIFRFDPRNTGDQSLTLKHTLKYANETLFILEGSDVAGSFIEVKELVVFDSFKIQAYKGSAVALFAGGGQVFNSGYRAFYSITTDLNDQIGEALLATGSVSQTVDDTPSVPTLSTVAILITTAPYSQTLSLTSTECEGYISTEAPQLIDNSEMTKTSTHPKTRCMIIKGKSPKPVKPNAKTRPPGSSLNEQGRGTVQIND